MKSLLGKVVSWVLLKFSSVSKASWKSSLRNTWIALVIPWRLSMAGKNFSASFQYARQNKLAILIKIYISVIFIVTLEILRTFFRLSNQCL